MTNPITMKAVYRCGWDIECHKCAASDRPNKLYSPADLARALDFCRQHLRNHHGYGTCIECGRITKPGMGLHWRCLFVNRAGWGRLP